MYIVVQIKASDVDFTGEEISIMRFKHTNKIYPPQVKMTVAMINSETQNYFPLYIGNLKNALKELYPLAKNWYNIGVSLNVEDHILDKISSDVDGIDNQLCKMLSEWFKRVDRAPNCMPTNLPEAKNGTNFLKKWDFWSKSETFLQI